LIGWSNEKYKKTGRMYIAYPDKVLTELLRTSLESYQIYLELFRGYAKKARELS